MANAAAASAAAAGDSGDPDAAAKAKAAAAASLKMAEESAAKSAEIMALKEEVESLQTERDGLLSKLAAVQAAGASAANDTAEAQVARPVAAQLAGVRAEAMSDLQGKKFSAAKNTLAAGVKSALEELQSGSAESAYNGLKKLYSTALKKKGAAGVA